MIKLIKMKELVLHIQDKSDIGNPFHDMGKLSAVLDMKKENI